MSYRILLVDPDPRAAAAAEKMLAGSGYRVASVSTFEAGVQQASKDRPDLLVTALRLREFNGLHLLMRCRRANPHLPAIITGNPQDATRDIEAFGAHFVDVTVGADGVLALVTDLLRRSPRREAVNVNTRMWPRKPAHLPTNGDAAVVEVSYGGVRLKTPHVPNPPQTPIQIEVPALGLCLNARVCWSKHDHAEDCWLCGAEVTLPDAEAACTWRRIVDTLN